MKTFFVKPFGCGSVALCTIALPFLVAWPLAAAPPFQEARVSEVIRDVRLLESHGAPRPAVVNDKVTLERAVRTGVESRAELTFTDLTITRLGANTIFALKSGAREVDLTSGTILLEVPSGKAPVKASTGFMTVAVTGGTALLGTGPPIKFMVLEGTGTMYPKDHPEKAVSLKVGEMVMATANGKISQPAQFDVKLVLATSHLILDFPPLTNLPLILAVVNLQLAEQQLAGTTSQPLAKNLVDVVDVTSQATSVSATPPPSATPLPSATPPPTKFGPPSAITSPNPYIINASTTINTDPTITTKGVTNFGKIYRDLSQDGPFATWLGSSPRPFDTAFGDNFQPDNQTVPIPTFIFSSLRLVGDPKVSNSSNFPTLGLGSLGGITSAPTGAVFTFGGIDQVGLVALNGSIDLSGISFANFGRLYIYARGAGSDLTLAAPISNLRRVQLNAEHNITVSAPVTVNDTVINQTGFRARAGNDIQISSTVKANQMEIDSLGSIHINSSAQLLAMINSAGTHGQVVILATGTSGTVDVGGQIQAEQGSVDISETGDNGVISINGATLHGDIVKIGALGANGVLNIGGGTLSADTTLKLYASGSNGQLNFLSNVTLGGNSTKILAANSVSIFNNVTVTIGGTTPAAVYTNNANYTGFGGNGSTTGTFAGAGANSPQPLSSAPPFDPPPLATVSKVTSGKTTGAAIDVSSTGELLSLLDGASIGRDGKITISGAHSINNLKNLNGTNINGLSRADRRMLIQQMHDERRDTAPVGGKRILSL